MKKEKILLLSVKSSPLNISVTICPAFPGSLHFYVSGGTRICYDPAGMHVSLSMYY
jgi:hypothetical protein